MVDAKQAAIMAREYLVQMAGIQPTGVTLEEVTKSDTGNFWFITLSYYVTESLPLPFFQGQPTKTFKIFQINSTSGEVVSMKIWKP